MGYNTVAILLNDTLHIGAKDPRLGERIQEASRNWFARSRGASLDVIAHEERSGCSHIASYGSIISQDHADGFQVVVVHGNCGARLGGDDARLDLLLGQGSHAWQAFDAMKNCLERHGYRVTKARKRVALEKEGSGK